MKKTRKNLITLAIALALTSSFILGASASSTLTAIKAYLNYGITIEYNGEAQKLFDANGVRLYPISYNDSTYVPIRAVSNILGVNVDWDQARQTVVLGTPTDGVDLINKYLPYSYATISYGGYFHTQSTENKSATVAGITLNHWIELGYNYLGYSKNVWGYYNIGGNYGTLTFKAYSTKDMTLEVKGNDDVVLASIPLIGNQMPKTYTVPLAGATQLSFSCAKANGTTYIFDTILK